ncbi:MAG: hypothetical protein M1608_11980 [Candidatus Omnitrophica bacterium]|nr:hypothetical protein [Candidatus Omnitrophota bacterium]
MPTNNESYGSVNLPSANQFQGLLSFAAVPGLTSNEWINLTNHADLQAGTKPFDGEIAQEMGLPVGKSGNAVALVFRRVEVD